MLASIFCILQHRESWAAAVTSALKLGGDVDTLGAIVGALAGAVHGIDGIPSNLVAGLQDTESIQLLATCYHSLMESRSASGAVDEEA